ncbi:ABC transporter permease [Corynebacterium lubricantis]|uniref:ABC transporter permease n=1 Tax=Corynebacterium lubricantis TaxID=541095 RepID=UPI0003706898|nr:ABC transporter permease [Corynebacterium lubricantis]
MIVRNILAEWTKLRTTASFWWTSGLILAIALGFTGLTFGLGDNSVLFGASEFIISSFWTGSLIAIIVMATMVVTTEYRFKISGTNFQVTPVRWEVAVAKYVLYAVIAAILSFVALVASYMLADALVDGGFAWTEQETATRALWAVPLAVALMVMFCQGIGWLLRQTAGAITLVLFWWLFLESAVSMIPKVGDAVYKYLPMHNINDFVMNAPGADWTIWEAFGIFGIWAVVLWIAGIVVLERRDA